MKKTLIALAVLGSTAGVAYAQSNVTIYGVMDMGYMKTSGQKWAMDENVNSRLGFMGQEDLGGGLKATFQLEERFKPFNGKENTSKGSFEGASNIGLAGNSWGQVRFGRLNEISTETLRKLDPFDQYGVGGMADNYFRGMNNGRLSSTVRYDSPNFNGFKIGATYTLKGQTNGTLAYGSKNNTDSVLEGNKNDGYALGATYNNGPVSVLANYNRAVDSNDSFNWNIGGAYAFGPAKIALAYEQTKNKLDLGIANDKEKRYLVGVTYNIGAGLIKASYNHSDNADWADNASKKYALGYTHNLSKRTSVYADYAHEKVDGSDSTNSYMVGMTHKF